MDVTGANLELLHQAYNARFRKGLIGRQAAAQWKEVAMETTSATREEQYGWLDALPGLRRWIGDRTLNQLSQSKYALENLDWEETVAVDRNAIEDDQYGVYGARFQAMGEAAAAHPDEVLWPLLKSGFGDDNGMAYDDQYFFDTDHKFVDQYGVEQSQANTDGGGGTKWFLLDSRHMARPLIWQVRKPASDIVMMTDPQDEHVFSRREFRFGIDCRDAAGFGFYQTCWGSGQTLDQAHYETARRKLQEMRKDGGRPLGIVPNKLIVPPELEAAARKTVVVDRLANGAENPWAGTAEVVVVPWLA